MNDDEDDLLERKVCGCSLKLLICIFFAIGLILAVPAASFMLFFELLVERNIVLKHNSLAEKEWSQPPVPVYMTYNVFNYTNVDRVVEHGDKPHVKQLGPYTYKEVSASFDEKIKYGTVRAW